VGLVKHLLLFSGELHTTAYAHVRSLMQPVIAAITAGIPAGPPPSKKAKNDVRVATLKFPSSETLQGPVVPEFDRYLSASIDIDALQ